MTFQTLKQTPQSQTEDTDRVTHFFLRVFAFNSDLNSEQSSKSMEDSDTTETVRTARPTQAHVDPYQSSVRYLESHNILQIFQVYLFIRTSQNGWCTIVRTTPCSSYYSRFRR
ncbi:uncharacterized protein tex55 isoform X2 [Astyanax mexicanus]|uniref:uncharacterized protein tex55 isoform X2 n=1 Tax=Astyanax mexicanus TaxID=7994 RepID=UPI0020CAC235|nr:uncharacterized protein tex55 isoform X2 [Astyanax mexicanus]